MQLPLSTSLSNRKLRYPFSMVARYTQSQSQDLFSIRLQGNWVCAFLFKFCFLFLSNNLVVSVADGIQNLPKLVEDIVQTSINTGPRGPLRLAQAIQAVIGVGSEWVADASKVKLSDYPIA